jgi:hypothetical protein
MEETEVMYKDRFKVVSGELAGMVGEVVYVAGPGPYLDFRNGTKAICLWADLEKAPADSPDLAADMRAWERKRRELDELEARIAAAILSMPTPATQVLGSVRATYSQGRRTLDYKAGALAFEPGRRTIARFIKRDVDWKGLWEELKHPDDQPPVLKQSDPSVTIKLVEGKK